MCKRVIVRLGHGYFKGGVEPLPDICPTIDAHIACWHVLIGEKIEMNCKIAGRLGGKVRENNGLYAPSLRHGRLRTDGDNVWGGILNLKLWKDTK